MPEVSAISVLVLTGPVGVGKTTVGHAVVDLLERDGVAHALIDLDWLRYCSPRPAHDRFHTALGLQNLATVWANYRAAGARRLVVVDVVETRAMIAAYHAAIPDANIVVVRLHAPLATILERLAGREIGASLAWHQQRAVELTTQMEQDCVEDVRIDTGGRAVLDIALEIMRQLQWAG